MRSSAFLAFAAALLLSGTAALAADAAGAAVIPAASEWEPVQQAIDAEAPDAEDRLRELLTTYPTWADGNKALARLLLDQGKANEALGAARRATQLAPGDLEAMRIQVRALTSLGRKSEIYGLVDSASTKDAGGWLRYEAGLAAATLGDAAKADAYLSEARVRVGAKVPAEFLFLESRIAILGRDFVRAEKSLSDATTRQFDFWDGWYELGRVRLVLADNDQTQRSEWVKKAGEAFAAVARGVPGDPNGHVGLARVALERAKLLAAEGQDDNAGAYLRDAVAALNRALELRPAMTEAHVLLGDALIRLERWDEAATSLRRAQGLGAKERTLVFNLAIALQQTGRPAEADELLKTVTASSPAEQVTIGMGAYRSRNWQLAATLLEKSVADLDDRTAQGATWRIIGHARTHLAEARTGEERDRHLDAAAAAYRTAGDLVDFPARRFYLAAEAARSSERAYDAAWTVIDWDTRNLPAWGEMLATYGLAKTGGEGLGGMAKRAPVHLAVWVVLVVLPLLLFIKNLIRRVRQPPAIRPARPTRAKPSQSAKVPTSSTQRPTRSGRLPVHQKSETEPLDPVQPPSRKSEKAETATIPAPLPREIRPQARPTPAAGVRAPERRKH